MSLARKYKLYKLGIIPERYYLEMFEHIEGIFSDLYYFDMTGKNGQIFLMYEGQCIFHVGSYYGDFEQSKTYDYLFLQNLKFLGKYRTSKFLNLNGNTPNKEMLDFLLEMFKEFFDFRLPGDIKLEHSYGDEIVFEAEFEFAVIVLTQIHQIDFKDVPQIGKMPIKSAS